MRAAAPGGGASDVLARSCRIEVEQLDGDILVWHNDNMAMHRLSGTGAAVFTQVDGQTSGEEIAICLAAGFAVDVADIRAEVLAFLNELLDLQLVKPAVA